MTIIIPILHMRKLRPRGLSNLSKVIKIVRGQSCTSLPVCLSGARAPNLYCKHRASGVPRLGLVSYLSECFDIHIRLVSLNLEFGIVLVQIYSLLKKSILIIKLVRTQDSSTVSGQSKKSIGTSDKAKGLY